MTTKEIKTYLKAARASIDGKKYEEAIEKCQVVSNYYYLLYFITKTIYVMITDGVCHR